MISYLSISLVIRHDLNVHPVHSPALYVCLDQANDVTPRGRLNLYELKTTTASFSASSRQAVKNPSPGVSYKAAC